MGKPSLVRKSGWLGGLSRWGVYGLIIGSFFYIGDYTGYEFFVRASQERKVEATEFLDIYDI